MEPDRHCLTKRLQKNFSGQQKQMTFVVIGALRAKVLTITSVDYIS